jgi:hypothetical protein
MKLNINPHTGKHDALGMTAMEQAAYLKLDQTVPQTVIAGAPIFYKGIVIKSGEKLVLDG